MATTAALKCARDSGQIHSAGVAINKFVNKLYPLLVKC